MRYSDYSDMVEPVGKQFLLFNSIVDVEEFTIIQFCHILINYYAVGKKFLGLYLQMVILPL